MLKTNIVFLDANVFYRENFNFLSSRFTRLRELSSEFRLNLHSTDLIVREVEKGIVERIRNATNVLQRAAKPDNAGILRNCTKLDFSSLFSFSEDEVIQDFREQLSDFTHGARVSLLSVDSVSNAEVSERYFSLTPPFKEGTKRAEFPDAFSLCAILNWCEQKEVDAYVVSSDGDWKAFCEDNKRLLWLESVDDLLDLVASQDQTAQKARLLYQSLQEQIADNLTEAFENFGFFLDDRDGDVVGTSVISVERLGEFLLSLDSEVAVFGCDFELSYTAQIIYDDPEYGYYDSDDHRFYSLRSVNQTLERTISLFTEVLIDIQQEQLKQINVPNVTDVAVTVEPDEYFR